MTLTVNKVFSIFLRGQLETTVAEEKEFNPRLSKSLEEFVEIMKNLNLPYPKKIGESKVVVQFVPSRHSVDL